MAGYGLQDTVYGHPSPVSRNPFSVTRLLYTVRAMRPRLLILLALAVVGAAAGAAEDEDESGFFDFSYTPGAPWRELPSEIPQAVNEKALVELPVDRRGSPFRYYMDLSALRRKEDNVVRYLVVVRSPTGARNVLYEGLRCDTGEYKTYAFGDASGRLRPLPAPHWRPVSAGDAFRYRHELLTVWLCEGPLARPTREAIARIRHGAEEASPVEGLTP